MSAVNWSRILRNPLSNSWWNLCLAARTQDWKVCCRMLFVRVCKTWGKDAFSSWRRSVLQQHVYNSLKSCSFSRRLRDEGWCSPRDQYVVLACLNIYKPSSLDKKIQRNFERKKGTFSLEADLSRPEFITFLNI